MSNLVSRIQQYVVTLPGFNVHCMLIWQASLFVTFTCNPKWPEIQNALLPNQVAANRPDIVVLVHVFKMKP